ncbi:TldD/PmbA family protein [Hespellia stercorisuis]|uniref:TldD protein n=1 Tax=Hespellia stercorisuis DSM 15480 TaxID=1121950 RepID=A0A1M6KMF5_9FIRM|nr:TldD/PmbA family protein [Hespellia stercorisuis]SHJ60082.1 TldD protein [Hespellia stercorisuis DSM 15480]
MLSKSMIEDVLDEACLRGADFAEVYDENTFLQETQLNQEEIEQSLTGRECGVGIRVFKGDSCYYGYTNEKSEGVIQRLTRDLTKSMKDGSMTGDFVKSGSVPGNFRMRDGLFEKKNYTMGKETALASAMPLGRRLEPAKLAIRAGMAYDEEIVRMRVKLTDMEQLVQIANTEGIYVQDQRVKTRLYMTSFAQSGTDLQSGYYGPGAMRGHDYYDRIDVEAAAREASRQAKTILHARECQGGQMSVVVDNGFGGLLFHEACGHSLEATVIARDSSEFCGKLGTQVASDVVTLVDDGSIPNEWGSLHVDDEGMPTQRNVLIEQGILKSYLVDQLNGQRAKLAPTGSARRQNYKYIPTARMTNTYIAPGDHAPEEIIGATEHGLYVRTINGGSVDPATGDFNFSAGECYMIEHGRIGMPVRGVTLIGNGGSVLKKVDMVGNDFDLRQGYCFASSGALFIDAGQPTVRISSMTVGGIG